MVELCKKCNTEITQNYCPNCGHPRHLDRIDARYVLSEIISVLNFQKGFLFTIKELLLRPGKSVRIFISEDRSRLVKPIMFLLITSLVYTFLVQLLHFENMYVSYSDTRHSTTLTIMNWVQGNYGYANILMAVFIALWLKIFFRGSGVNVFEILILLSFVMGMGMLFYAAFGLMQSLVHVYLMQFGAMVAVIYTTYAIGQFFDKRRVTSYAKALWGYLLGMLTFLVAIIVVGTVIDWILLK